MEIIAFITTIFAGILAESTIGVTFNMHGIGSIAAVAVMGSFILWFVRRKT